MKKRKRLKRPRNTGTYRLGGASPFTNVFHALRRSNCCVQNDIRLDVLDGTFKATLNCRINSYVCDDFELHYRTHAMRINVSSDDVKLLMHIEIGRKEKNQFETSAEEPDVYYAKVFK